MKYTDKVIELELMDIFGFGESEAQTVVASYRGAGKLDDLCAAIKAKKEVSRFDRL